MKPITIALGIAILALISFSVINKPTPPPGDNSQTTSPQTEVPNPTSSSRYRPYAQSGFNQEANRRRILFFHAPWCPTCRATHLELSENSSRIPEDVVIFQTDYDSEDELKRKHNITYQHTFVQVDSEGNEVAQWNGGGLDQILENLN